MQPETRNVHASDGHIIPVFTWSSARPARGVVQILHGLGEHSARYGRLAAALTAEGYHVVAHDQRGHGANIAYGTQGFFADENGWQYVVSDVGTVRAAIGEHFPGLPVVLLGHSMGSYVAQAAMLQDAKPYAALALSGSTFSPRISVWLGRWLARFERLRVGPRSISRTLTRQTFGQYNKVFEPTRTAFDWLSRDEAEVDSYIEDAWCGFHATTQLWIDLMTGIISISSIKALKALPGTLPVYVFGGGADPISAGDRLSVLAAALDAAGVGNVVLKVYEDARHEVFNETNRDQITADLIAWLNTTVTSNENNPV